jgi:hypothetical protein
MGHLRHFAFFLLFLIAVSPAAHSLYCVGITQGVDWDDVKLQNGTPAFFTTRIYNTSSGGGYCEPGEYTLSLSLRDSPAPLDEAFSWELKPDKLSLSDNDNQQVLLTLTPKIDGQFTVVITVTRGNPGSGSGTKIVSTSAARINITVGNAGDSKFTTVPFWTVRKDCPGGFVVKQGEDCPHACEDGSASVNGVCLEDSQNLSQPQVPQGQPGVIEKIVPVIPAEILGVVIIAVLALGGGLVCALLYIRKLKHESGGRHR